MANYRSSRIIPTILTVIIIIVAIAGIVALARLIFTGSTSQADKVVDTSRQDLLNTSAERSVSMTIRGPIVADEDFRSYRITISPISRQFEAYTGYLDTTTSQQTLANTTAAYEQFVNALDKANMSAGKPFEGDKNNILGICATGKVYEFNILDDGASDEMLWTSTCNGSPGSLKASASQLSQLFLNQIPDGSGIASELQL